jgi:hypothetical protein
MCSCVSDAETAEIRSFDEDRRRNPVNTLRCGRAAARRFRATGGAVELLAGAY